jgi:hypothetical protein
VLTRYVMCELTKEGLQIFSHVDARLFAVIGAQE